MRVRAFAAIANRGQLRAVRQDAELTERGGSMMIDAGGYGVTCRVSRSHELQPMATIC